MSISILNRDSGIEQHCWTVKYIALLIIEENIYKKVLRTPKKFFKGKRWGHIQIINHLNRAKLIVFVCYDL